MDWLNRLGSTAKSIIGIALIVIPVSSVSLAVGGWLGTREMERIASDNRVAITEIRMRLDAHIDSNVHIQRSEVDRINRRLCMLMQANGITDADCIP